MDLVCCMIWILKIWYKERRKWKIKTTIVAYLCWVIESDDVANLDYYTIKKNLDGEEREHRMKLKNLVLPVYVKNSGTSISNH